MVEQWKDIPAYEGLYQVSDHGRLSVDTQGHIVAAEFAVAAPEEPAS